MKLPRSYGILLHPTSLPGSWAIGDLGPGARTFLDWISDAGAHWWQVLPLNPPEETSPYGGLSAFAGNPLLISPDLLAEDGLLEPRDLRQLSTAATDKVDFEVAATCKRDLLELAWQRFKADLILNAELDHFVAAEEQRPWLDEWTLFSALREQHGTKWWEWPSDLAHHQPESLARAAEQLAQRRRFHAFGQWLFFRQWQGLRGYAAERQIKIFGDLPIYVPATSVEVWAHRRLFELDKTGRQLAQAGVPPDYFSETGQLWGFPLYRWQHLADQGYRWWIDRLAANLHLADLVRLDHFRAFAGYWRVPADAQTAADGSWCPGPGRALFEALENALGTLPLVAEDLGEITDDVKQLRRDLGLPGMRVLQFGFDDPQSPHALHNLGSDSVVYTGTHDNDTLVGWYSGLDDGGRQRVDDYLAEHRSVVDQATLGLGFPWQVIEQAFASVAELAMLPMQDVLGLGSEARMNTPGTVLDNWRWRLQPEQLTADSAGHLYEAARRTDRLR